jgi:hypothetical protein
MFITSPSVLELHKSKWWRAWRDLQLHSTHTPILQDEGQEASLCLCNSDPTTSPW